MTGLGIHIFFRAEVEISGKGVLVGGIERLACAQANLVEAVVEIAVTSIEISEKFAEELKILCVPSVKEGGDTRNSGKKRERNMETLLGGIGKEVREENAQCQHCQAAEAKHQWKHHSVL
jgi:hypothetical protein